MSADPRDSVCSRRALFRLHANVEDAITVNREPVSGSRRRHEARQMGFRDLPLHVPRRSSVGALRNQGLRAYAGMGAGS